MYVKPGQGHTAYHKEKKSAKVSVDLVAFHRATCFDRKASAQLNALGHRHWKGESFTSK
jgi:hypothetical protein